MCIEQDAGDPDLYELKAKKSRLSDVNYRTIFTDCEFHGFVATKSRRDRPSIVTETYNDTIRMGTILTAVNGVPTDRMTPLELHRYFTGREVKVIPIFRIDETVKTNDSDVGSDQVST